MVSELLDHVAGRSWLPQLGKIEFPAANQILMERGDQVGSRGDPTGSLFHAEARHVRVLGADFSYSATIIGDWTNPMLRGDLQFRISDEGRYGVSLKSGRVQLYRFTLPDRKCDIHDGTTVAHCPSWPLPPDELDDPVLQPRGPHGMFDVSLRALRLTVQSRGSRMNVLFGPPGGEPQRIAATNDTTLGVGRFGVYGLSNSERLELLFTDVSATHDPTAASNFALLYNTAGYEASGYKQALVRTLNDVDESILEHSGSSFSVIREMDEIAVLTAPFAVQADGTRLTRSLGVQVLRADFSDVQEPGRYRLKAQLATTSGTRTLESEPFNIRSRLVTETALWPLSTRNAAARRAADEDFRRNWRVETGSWSVGLDGAFIADRADDQLGAKLRRVFDIGNATLGSVGDFQLLARITILAGCDAQLQFAITDRERWAVTLQAGSAGGCAHGEGPGAIRLHREGIGVDARDHFQILDAKPLPRPFEVGRTYALHIKSKDGSVRVLLDDVEHLTPANLPRLPAGGFGLKAWGSTVRFSNVLVWPIDVELKWAGEGVWIPWDKAVGKSFHNLPIPGVAAIPDKKPATKYPFAAQHYGFHDCNNYIGEITSHSIFLTSLLDIWETRAATTNSGERESLRRAILTAVLYLDELYDQGGRGGAYAHQEPGRGAFAPGNPVLTTQFAMHALASFAERGLAVDEHQARLAFDKTALAWIWLDAHGGRESTTDSAVAARMVRAAALQGRATQPWLDRAVSTARAVLADFSAADAMTHRDRPTLRSIPWFEGLYLAWTRGLLHVSAEDKRNLESIANQLETLLNNPANRFHVIPQGHMGDPPRPEIAVHNWTQLADFPLAHYPIPGHTEAQPGSPAQFPVGDWHLCEHFATAALDSVYVARLTGRTALEPLATGNLSWILGLNPGIPTTKTVRRSTSFVGPWSASSLIYNGDGTFARTIEGWRMQASSAKGWLAEWEKGKTSRHRETWWIDPGNNGFQSITNGHVLREGQWHYWSIGRPGWVSGEVFLLLDGSFLRAALAIEDWLNGQTTVTGNPHDDSRPQSFDTTHVDRLGTEWMFDDPDITPWAQATRMATGFAQGKGFRAARLTGHHVGERVGVVCLPHGVTSFIDVSRNEIRSAAWGFEDINTVSWARAGRAAVELAQRHQFPVGFFTGHQTPLLTGLIAVHSGNIDVDYFDRARMSAFSSEGFANIDEVGWAQAARVATAIAHQVAGEYAGAFFTGVQRDDRFQLFLIKATTPTPPVVEFASWSRIDTGQATGTLLGKTVAIDGPLGTGSVTNGTSPMFAADHYTPALAATDVVNLVSLRGSEFRLKFAEPVRNVVLHLASLASRVTFTQATPVARVSGDPTFVLSGPVASGVVAGSHDSGGTLRIHGTLSELTFVAEPVFADGTIQDGFYLQIGAEPV